MHIEFCAKLNFLEGEYAIMQNIGFLLSSVGNPCRYLVLRPCKIRTDFVEALLANMRWSEEESAGVRITTSSAGPRPASLRCYS